MDIALLNQNIKMQKLLFKNGYIKPSRLIDISNDINERLVEAIKNSDEREIVNLLIEGADPMAITSYGECAFKVAYDLKKYKLLETLTYPSILNIPDSYDIYEKLEMAIRLNRLDLVEKYMKEGADPNKINIWEVVYENHEMVELINKYRQEYLPSIDNVSKDDLNTYIEMELDEPIEDGIRRPPKRKINHEDMKIPKISKM